MVADAEGFRARLYRQYTEGGAVMHKSDLVDAIAEKAGLTKKDADRALQAALESIEDALCEEDKVSLMGFGTFEVRYREERPGRNPSTGKSMTIPASYSPAFRASKSLKDKVNDTLTS